MRNLPLSGIWSFACAEGGGLSRSEEFAQVRAAALLRHDDGFDVGPKIEVRKVPDGVARGNAYVRKVKGDE